MYIDRKVFKDLSSDELKKRYISGSIPNNYINQLEQEEIDEVIYGVFQVIDSNEKLINKVGMEKYINEDYPASIDVTGFFYRSGKIIISADDWSVDDNQEFDYSFTLSRIL